MERDGRRLEDAIERFLSEDDDADVADLERIVRAVADTEPMAYCPGDEMTGDWYECGFCEVQAETLHRYDWHEVEHRESCPWRLAREWVADHPAQ